MGLAGYLAAIVLVGLGEPPFLVIRPAVGTLDPTVLGAVEDDLVRGEVNRRHGLKIKGIDGRRTIQSRNSNMIVLLRP